jgi:hypothetical protein
MAVCKHGLEVEVGVRIQLLPFADFVLKRAIPARLFVHYANTLSDLT